MLDRAIDSGRAPALRALVERGVYIRDCVSAFPSVTPVASASITTGLGPDRHHIPSMNWYHRGEERYVEYGSSFAATRTFGIVRSLYDTVYNMNLAHLSREERTVFELVEDAGLRAACTTYLIFRGRHRHAADEAGPYTRIAKAAQFRHAVWGPTELFYADLFASRRTDCRSTLGMPGQRDRHSGCVAAHMVENDLFDFLLLSLPDNDTHSHRYGPYAQVELDRGGRPRDRAHDARGRWDRRVPRGPRGDRALRSLADAGRAPREPGGAARPPRRADARRPARGRGDRRLPAARSAMVYVLDPDDREAVVPVLARELCEVEGMDLVAHMARGRGGRALGARRRAPLPGRRRRGRTCAARAGAWRASSRR